MIRLVGLMLTPGVRAMTVVAGVDPAHPWLMNVWDLAFETDFSCASPQESHPTSCSSSITS